MNKEQFILRQVVLDSSFIFYNPDRTYKSKKFKTREDRDKAIDKYIEKELILQKEVEAKRKKEYQLTHE